MRHVSVLLLCGLCWLTLAVAAQDEAGQTAPPPLKAERFECENAFDLIAMMVVARCSLYEAPPGVSDALLAAAARLRELGLASDDELRVNHMAFCPLAAGTGMVPAPGQLYLDDGLVGMSRDGLAEILAHELVHIRQFARLGTREFKCEYVRDMLACGGCQDRGHALEAEAYKQQDEVRERLLKAR